MGSEHRGLGADERGFGALVGGSGAVDRALVNGAGVSGGGLLAGGEGDRGAGVVERFLLTVAADLSVVKRFLVDVTVDLFAIDSRLAVVKDRCQALIWRAALVALLVVTDLLQVDAGLLAVTGELFAVTDRLLQFGQALLLGERARSCFLVRLERTASEPSTVTVSWVTRCRRSPLPACR